MKNNTRKSKQQINKKDNQNKQKSKTLKIQQTTKEEKNEKKTR